MLGGVGGRRGYENKRQKDMIRGCSSNVCVCGQVEGVAERELQSLHDTVYDQALVWVNSLKAEQKERIEGHFGPMPRKDSVLQVHTHNFQSHIFSSDGFRNQS